MTTTITLPNLGESIESGDVLTILVSEGETISVDQDLLEIETDKATMPVPSPAAGTITKILINEGDTIAVGAKLIEITPAEAASAAPQQEPQQDSSSAPQATPKEPAADTVAEATAVAPPAKPQAAEATAKPQVVAEPVAQIAATEVDIPGDGHSSAAAGPAVRRLARELGVDLRRVRPTGEGGRVTAEDVRGHVRLTNEQAASDTTQGITPPGTPDSDEYGAVRRDKMSRMRQTIARNMTLSYTTIPQLTNFDDVDITELERIRQDSKDDYDASGIKLTSMPFLIKAAASALRLHPVVNASLGSESDADEQNQIIYKEYVNIGIAVDTDRGLLVPVLRDADRKSIPQVARELAEMATAARSGDFNLDALRGGTFTISNLGAIGGTYSTPIINPPEVAILLAGRSRMLPQLVKDQAEGHFEPRLVMPLSLTYDHRIVDGAAAARFLNDVKRFLANPGRLLLAP